MEKQFKKYDNGKARFDLVDPVVEKEVAEVMTFGAEKYAPNNWLKCPSAMKYYAATRRHLTAWRIGEDLDPETGKSHLAHAICSIMMMWGLVRLKPNTDDRKDLLEGIVRE